MKKLLSIRYSDGAFNFSMLLLRLGFGLYMMLVNGMPKITEFAKMQLDFPDPLGVSPKVSLILTIFAEVFCSIFLIIGLFTRLAVIPLLFTMIVIVFVIDKGALEGAQMAMLYLIVYFVLLLLGPGRISVDGMMKK